ncbi:MAG: RAD55 family ATPase [Methanoculleaceae archaeon]
MADGGVDYSDRSGTPAEPGEPETCEMAGATKMPTGIESLDPVLDGGVPSGSVILLLSDIGGGGAEFAYSSLLSLSDMLKEGGAAGGEIVPPTTITYITITRMTEDIIRDITLSFRPGLSENIRETVTFHDLSRSYFENSVVPVDWYSKVDMISRFERRGRRQAPILAELADTISRTPPGGLIIIDSLTDLATQFTDQGRWKEFTAFLRGLQRITKKWGSTVYLELTSHILPLEQETEVADCVDALIVFRWEDAGAGRRRRVMFFEKFRGVMPHLEENDLVKFAVRISSAAGFEVSNIRVVI